MLDPAWGEPSQIINVKDNKMVMQPPLGMSQNAINQGLIFEDIDLGAKIRIAKGTDPAVEYVGLIFWAEDYDNYYTASLAPDGRFGIVRRVKGRWLYPVSYRKHTAIKSGVGEWNDLHIQTKGNTATLFINGEQVITFKGQPPRGGGMIGMHGESSGASQAVCEFSDLKVTK